MTSVMAISGSRARGGRRRRRTECELRGLQSRPVRANQRMLLGLLVVGVIETSIGLEKVHPGPAIVAALAGSPALAAIFGALPACTVRIWMQGGQPWVRGSLLRLCCGWWH